jgi:hypothetical protein
VVSPEQYQYEFREKPGIKKIPSLEIERHTMSQSECALQTFLSRYGLISLIGDVLSRKSLFYFVRNATLETT